MNSVGEGQNENIFLLISTTTNILRFSGGVLNFSTPFVSYNTFSIGWFLLVTLQDMLNVNLGAFEPPMRINKPPDGY